MRDAISLSYGEVLKRKLSPYVSEKFYLFLTLYYHFPSTKS